MKNKKHYVCKLWLIISVVVFSLLVSMVALADDDSQNIGTIRRLIDTDVVTKDLGVAKNSGHMYCEELYGNVFGHCTWGGANTNSKYVYEGSSAYLITLRANMTPTTMPYVYTAVTNVVLRCLDFEKTALQFMYKPMLEREEVYVGITCRSQDKNSSALKISLKDYIGLTSEDYEKSEWIKVTIPLTYFFEYGEFDSFLGTDTEFNRTAINGSMFAYSGENAVSVNTQLASVDNWKFVTLPEEPENLKFITDGSYIKVTWNGILKNTADKYRIYKDGKFLTELSGVASYEDSNVVNGNTYVYSVCSVSGTGERSVVTSQSVTAGSGSLTGYSKTSDITVTSDGAVFSNSKAHLTYSVNGEADEFVIYKNSRAYGRSSYGVFEDTNYTSGDKYSVSALNTKDKKMSYSASIAEGENLKIGDIIFDAMFTDENGTDYNNQLVVNGHPDRVKITTDNTTGIVKTAKFVAAMYNSENLVDLQLLNSAIPLGKTEATLPLEFYYDLPGDYRLKIMMLDNFSNLRPLSEVTFSEYVTEEKSANKLVVVGNQTYNEITGWGISPFHISKKDFMRFDDYEEWPEIFNKTYGELGLTSIRVPIDRDFGDENGPVPEMMDYVVKYIERAKDFGIDDWIICFWSPPAYMIEKREVDLDWTNYRWFLIEGNEEAYCDYVIECLDYLKDRDVGIPSGLCFQNEPQGGMTNPFYPLEQYKLVAKLLRNKLNESGYEDVLITGPETSAYYNCFRYTGGGTSTSGGGFNYDNFRNDTEYADAIGVFTTHTYTESAAKDADVAKFASETSDFPEKERWMTEVSGLGTEECTLSDGSMDRVMGPALFTMRLLSSDVGWAGMNRWYYWRAYTTHYNPDENGASYDLINNKYSQQAIMYGQPGGKVVTSKLYDCLRILFNNVPVGSKVKRVYTTDSTLVNKSALKSDILTFETPNGETVMMLVNISEENKSLNFWGITGNRAKILSVTGVHDDIISSSALVNNGAISNVHIPPRSVSFIISSDNVIN